MSMIMLCIIFLSVTTAMIQFATCARIGGAIGEYHLLRSECLSSSYPDYSLGSNTGNLVPTNNNNKVNCLQSNGVNTRYQSKSIVGIFATRSNEVSIDMWIGIEEKDNTQGSLVSICDITLFPAPCFLQVVLRDASSGSNCSKELYGQITAKDRVNTINFPSVAINSQDCTATTSSIHHVSVAITYNESIAMISNRLTKLYSSSISYVIDGDIIGRQSFTEVSTIGPWYPSTSWSAGSALILLGNALSSSRYGHIYYFAWYTKVLTDNDIIANYRGGIPFSSPVPLSSTITIQQNGEVGNHFYEPSYYNTPIQSKDLPEIIFGLYDFDDLPGSPNYNSSHGSYIVLSPPPSNLCSIYDIDGSPLLSTTLRRSAGLFVVRVRPAWNQYSTKTGQSFCSIGFRGVDSTSASLSAESATVNIIVLHVDRPPIATPQTLSAYALKPLVIQLSGTDIDSALVSVYIVSEPRQGSIFQVFANGSTSKTAISLSRNGTRITNNVNKIVYIYSGPEEPSRILTSGGLLTQEVFRFTVSDVEGRRSVPVTCNISVLSSIQAFRGGPTGAILFSAQFPASPAIAIEGTISGIRLFGQDMSAADRNLTAVILTLPSRGGLFRDIMGLVPLQAGDSLNLRNEPKLSIRGCTVYYRGRPGFFSNPTTAVNGSLLPSHLTAQDYIIFHVVSASPAASSTEIIQPITVGNVNQPTTIEFQFEEPYITGSIKILAYSGDQSASLRDEAIISGFSVTDPDYDTGIVVAHVSASNGGRVSLNRDYLGISDGVDFNSFKYCYGNPHWACKGSGYFDRSMVFVTSPSTLSAVLNGLTYQSTVPNIVDTINITIFDGEGGSCLSNTQQSTSTIRQGCFVSSVALQVNVQGFDSVSTTTSTFQTIRSVDYRLQIVALGIVIIMLILIIRCCCWPLCRRCCGGSNMSSSSSKFDWRGSTAQDRRSADWESRQFDKISMDIEQGLNAEHDYPNFKSQNSSNPLSRKAFIATKAMFRAFRSHHPNPIDDYEGLEKSRKRQFTMLDSIHQKDIERPSSIKMSHDSKRRLASLHWKTRAKQTDHDIRGPSRSSPHQEQSSSRRQSRERPIPSILQESRRIPQRGRQGKPERMTSKESQGKQYPTSRRGSPRRNFGDKLGQRNAVESMNYDS